MLAKPFSAPSVRSTPCFTKGSVRTVFPPPAWQSLLVSQSRTLPATHGPGLFLWDSFQLCGTTNIKKNCLIVSVVQNYTSVLNTVITCIPLPVYGWSSDRLAPILWLGYNTEAEAKQLFMWDPEDKSTNYLFLSKKPTNLGLFFEVFDWIT